jgi:hypothetical protein
VFFTFSVIQFSFTLTAIHAPKRLGANKCIKLVFGTEIWALCFILLFQDVPFFLIRFLILIMYTSVAKNYSIYFYVAKNLCLCIFEVYRIAVIYISEEEDSLDSLDNTHEHGTTPDPRPLGCEMSGTDIVFF